MLDIIADLINRGDAELAWNLLTDYLSENNETCKTDILKSSILLMKGLKIDFINAISKGFERNYRNYELYVLLAEFYSALNINQEYICLQQAMFYCDNTQDRDIIASQMMSIKDEISVRKTSVIILSYNTKDITKMCLDNLFSNCNSEDIEVLVVDNASKDGSVDMLKYYPKVKTVVNTENRGFAGGCNDGIAVANSENDILLLNSDALLLPNSLFWLKMGLYEANDVGCTGSITNFAGNDQAVAVDTSSFEKVMEYALMTNIPMYCPYVKKIFLVGFSMLIKREAMNKVGVLDERFNPGNFEDTDYGVRLAEEGYKMLLCRNSFVYHFGHKSIQKIDTDFNSLMETNRKKFVKKWGIDILDYSQIRFELVDYIKRDNYEEFNVLEVGCGCGCTMGYLEGKYPNAHIDGIEVNQIAADIGGKIFNIYQDDFESPKQKYKAEYYDYILLGNVLECLYNPKGALERAYKLLKPNGYVIVGIPNFMHISVLTQLLNGRFDYEESGIPERTHIRFFTLQTITELLADTGYMVKNTTAIKDNINYKEELGKIMTVAGKNVPSIQFEAYQYLLVAQKPD